MKYIKSYILKSFINLHVVFTMKIKIIKRNISEQRSCKCNFKKKYKKEKMMMTFHVALAVSLGYTCTTKVWIQNIRDSMRVLNQLKYASFQLGHMPTSEGFINFYQDSLNFFYGPIE